MRTIAVSSPLMAFLFRANLFRVFIHLSIFFSLFDHEAGSHVNWHGFGCGVI